MRVLDRVLLIARKSYKQHPEFEQSRYLHYSFIIYRNSLVGYGVNRGNTVVPKHLGYDARICVMAGKEHSEYAAWRRTRDLLKPGWWMINLRLNRQGKIMMAAPCKCCTNFLTSVGCSKVLFSLDSGFATTHLDIK